MALRVTRQGKPLSISTGRNMVRGLALSVALCFCITSVLVAATAARADTCGGRTGNPIHTKAWIGFTVDKKGNLVKGKLVQLNLAKRAEITISAEPA